MPGHISARTTRMNLVFSNASSSKITEILGFIDQYWSKLIRYNPDDKQTLIGLPHPYVVPSDGEMFQEMYYWDSFFISVGLAGTGYEDLILGMTRNMAHLFERFGVIPNASRYYFLSRSQPPFFTKLIWLAYDVLCGRGSAGTDEFLRAMMAIAEHEHEQVWLGKYQPHHRVTDSGLSRYFDSNFLDILASCESGWDHSTRCDDRWMHHLPVDLNSILYAREMDFARAAELLRDNEKAAHWRNIAANRADTMTRLMWDEDSGFFFDCDIESQKINPTPTLAGFFPLWAGLATEPQVLRMVETWLPKFEQAGGLVTSLDHRTDRQWAFPNGWAPLQWIVTEGLDRYGYHEAATRIREKWCRNCVKVFEKSGAFWEKYNVVEPEKVPENGLYGSIAGFGWTNAIFIDFLKKLRSQKGSSGEFVVSETPTPVSASGI